MQCVHDLSCKIDVLSLPLVIWDLNVLFTDAILSLLDWRGTTSDSQEPTLTDLARLSWRLGLERQTSTSLPTCSPKQQGQQEC